MSRISGSLSVCTCLTCASYVNRLHAWKPADCELKKKKEKKKHRWMFNPFLGILWWTICCRSSFPSTCLKSYIPQDAFWITPEKVPERVLWLWTKSKSCSVAAPVHSGLLRQLLVGKKLIFQHGHNEFLPVLPFSAELLCISVLEVSQHDITVIHRIQADLI